MSDEGYEYYRLADGVNITLPKDNIIEKWEMTKKIIDMILEEKK